MEHPTRQHPLLSAFKFVFSLVLVTALFWVCNSGTNQDDKKESSLVASTNLKMNCVILTKAQVQTWVDSGWTDKTKPENLIKKILLQFYGASGADPGDQMQLMAYPGKSYLNVYPGGKQVLGIDTTCVAQEYSGDYILGNTYADFDLLKITNPDGTLIDFSFVRFKPAQNFPPYINFTMEVVKEVGGVKTVMYTLSGGGTDPCPHYCP